MNQYKIDFPHFDFESEFLQLGFTKVCGVDEAGRGALAGPVTAAAVRFKTLEYPKTINDSKQLNSGQRNRIYDEIIELAEISFAHVGVNTIEQVNILNASLKAMAEAINQLPSGCDCALIDGNKVPKELNIESRAIIKGDQISASIAAASIVAKVERDRLMVKLSKKYPDYSWHTNKGYGTKEHLRMLEQHGPTKEHRNSFLPLRRLNLG